MSLELNDGDLLKSQAFIDGEWCDSNSGDSFDVSNPATGDVITAVASCGTEETRHAIEVADRALGSWRQTTAKERARLLRRWFDLMMEAQDDLAKKLTAGQSWSTKHSITSRIFANGTLRPARISPVRTAIFSASAARFASVIHLETASRLAVSRLPLR